MMRVAAGAFGFLIFNHATSASMSTTGAYTFLPDPRPSHVTDMIVSGEAYLRQISPSRNLGRRRRTR